MRVVFIKTFSTVISEPGTIEAGDDGESGRGWIAGHDHRLAAQIGQAGERDGAHATVIGGDVDFGAEGGQKLFGMVAGHHRLDDGGGAGDIEAGQQQAGFNLGRGHGARDS